jgi:glycosyltransferase involved in cell wall biosynthesis
MSRPLVTVVIPCFNQGRFLASAIQSVRNQHYQPIETIVVDDGSTDDTARVAAACGTQLIRQPNRGVAAARNAGMEAARGEYIVFLDADDELLPNAIESGVAFLENRHQLAGVVRQCYPMDVTGRVLPAQQPTVDSGSLYREWLSTNFVWSPGGALFRRRSILDIGGFPSDVSAAADYAVYLTLARDGRLALDPQPVLRYRQHDAAMSVDAARMLRATLEVLARERAHVPPNLMSAFKEGQRVWRTFYGEEIIAQLRHDWRQGRWGRSQLRTIYALIRCCPRLVSTNIARKVVRLLRGHSPEDLHADATTARRS